MEKEDEHSEVREQARSLFVKVSRKIDALSNFSFAPRPAVPDAKVERNFKCSSTRNSPPLYF
jgi:hypothetical protein